MKFDVPVVKKCLVECDQVYTVRKYETRNKFTVTEVCDIGSCMVEKIMQVISMVDLKEFVPLSGFMTLNQWWDKVVSFGAQKGWLYRVSILEDEFPQCPNLDDCQDAQKCNGCSATWTGFPADPRKTVFRVMILSEEEKESLSEMAFRDEAARMWQQKENEDLAYEGEY